MSKTKSAKRPKTRPAAKHRAKQPAAAKHAEGRPTRAGSKRKVDGWQTLATKPIAQPIDLAA